MNRARPSRETAFHFSLVRFWLFLTTLAAVAGAISSPSATLSAASQISSITPSCAAIGDSVTITGNGFGARNVTIKVGGVVAQVVSATGNKVTFIVPSGVQTGVVTVTATNPGGQDR